MPRFNVPAATVSRTVNLAGGEAFPEDARLELVSHILTSMVADQAYRSADVGLSRLSELLDVVDPLFAAKAAVYARQEHGLRSISHVIAGEIAHRVRGEQWTRPFFRAVVRRPDDMTEIVAYYLSKHGRRPLPNALREGIATAFGKFDDYQIAKYRSEGRAVSLIDVVNLVHPHPTDRNGEALKALVRGELASRDTWEALLTQAGQGDDDGKAEAKAEAWAGLVRDRKLGYFALLRNLRNIMQQAPDALDEALAQLVDADAIKRSLVLPFRYMTAASEIGKLPQSRAVLEALDAAATISVANVPRFDGRTLVVVDVSGSMTGAHVGRGKTMVADVAALFGAALYRSQDADLMQFADDARYLNVLPAGVLSTAQTIRQEMHGGGTDFRAIFARASLPYDRIVILSDMQGWVGYDAPTGAFEEYVRRVGKRPRVYSLDLAGMGTLQFPQAQVYALAGFSERIFDVMAALEQDRSALVSRIDAVTF